jgi:hypothetical protein
MVDDAAASPSIASFSFRSLNPDDGTIAAQAGAHSDLNTSLTLADPGEPETAKSLRISAPAGIVLYQDSAPRCSSASFVLFECSPSTQVGLITVRANHEGDPDFLLGTAPVYMLVSGAGEFARLGFVVPTLNLPTAIAANVRSESDFGLNLSIADWTQQAPMQEIDLTLWAIPAASSHDLQRFPAGNPSAPAGCPGVAGTSCVGGPSPVAVAEIPLLRSPTACTGAQSATSETDSYQHPGDFAIASSSVLGSTGCNRLDFGPMLTASLTTAETSAVSGLDLGLEINDEGATNPSGLSQSDPKAIAAELPEGLVVDEEAADGLTACTLAQVHLGAAEPESCPTESKIGDFTATVVGVEDPLEGSVYFGGVESAGAYGLYLTAAGSGLEAKFLASLETDADTGLASLIVADLPQFPFEELDLNLSQEAGLLVTPAACGDFVLRGAMTPWSNSSSFIATTSLKIETGPGGGPCPGPVENVVVSLEPDSIPADGESLTVATATVTDVNGYTFSGEKIAFSSGDPGEQVGPTVDNGDGTYSAEIIASKTAGPVTITASDESVEPEASGSAELTQTKLPAAAPHETPPVLSPTPLQVTLTSWPPHRTVDRTPTFRFVASVPGVAFRCKIDSHRYRACRSPLTLARLGFGPHTFRVRAVDIVGTDSEPITYRFRVHHSH